MAVWYPSRSRQQGPHCGVRQTLARVGTIWGRERWMQSSGSGSSSLLRPQLSWRRPRGNGSSSSILTLHPCSRCTRWRLWGCQRHWTSLRHLTSWGSRCRCHCQLAAVLEPSLGEPFTFLEVQMQSEVWAAAATDWSSPGLTVSSSTCSSGLGFRTRLHALSLALKQLGSHPHRMQTQQQGPERVRCWHTPVKLVTNCLPL